jgi:hypothetical protein
MHRAAFARPQRRTIRGRRTRAWALENRLPWHGTSRSRTHGRPDRRSGHTRRRDRPQGCFINRARPGLRNDHAGWRRCRGRWRGRNCWPGSHGRHLWRRRRRRRHPRRSRDGRSRTYRRTRRNGCRNQRTRRCRSHRRSRLNRGWRSGGRECRSRRRSWDYKFRRHRRSGNRRSRNGDGCRGRRSADHRLGFDGRCNWRGRVDSRRSLLFADDGF